MRTYCLASILFIAFLFPEIACSQTAVAESEVEMRSVPVSAYADFTCGVHLCLSGHFSEAEAVFLKALEIDPESSELHRFLGLVSRQLGRNTEALKYLKKAAQLNTNDPEVIWQLGTQYLLMNDITKAVECMEKSASLAPDSFEKHQDIANTYLRLQNIRGAIRHWEDALKTRLASTNSEVRAALIERIALSHKQLGEIPEAIEWYEKLLSVNSEPTLVHLALAGLYNNIGDTTSALDHLVKARDLMPGSAPVRLSLARSYLSLNRLEEAFEEFEVYVLTAPEDRNTLPALKNLIELSENLGRPEKTVVYRHNAIDLLKRFIASEPTPSLYWQLGILLTNDGQHDEAIVHLRKCAEMAEAESSDPNPGLYWQLGILLANNGQHDEAIVQLRKSAGMSEGDDARLVRQAIADVLQKADKIAEAEEELHKLTNDYPDSDGPPLMLARLLKDTNRTEKAIEILEEALPTVAKDKIIPIYLMLATYCEQLAKYDKTEDRLNEAMLIEPDNPLVNNHLGYFYAERGVNLIKAVKLVKKALSSDPDNYAFLDSLGWTYYKMARFAEARTALEEALEESQDVPDDPVIRDHYGDILWALGEQAMAREQWSLALELETQAPSQLDTDKIRLKIERGLEELPQPQTTQSDE